MENKILEKRSEILFCYDVTDANPNGDPLDSNKPRIDEETGINIVTDVRLKRTIRDYLMNFKGKEIFVREIIYDKEGHIQDAKLRARDFVELTGDEKKEEKEIITKFKKGEKISKKYIEVIKDNIRKNIIKKAIDIRLFGATIPLEFQQKEIIEKSNPIRSSVTLTGPIQFKMGRSLHKVEIKHIKGTGAFASKKNAEQKTFRDEFILPYSFIVFHGIINETAGKLTQLTDEDVNMMLDAMWNGTKNLISRSKFGQMPRLLIKITYKEKGFFIGDLEKKIKISGVENTLKIRSIKDFTIDISELLNVLQKNESKVDSVDYKMDEALSVKPEIPNSWKELKLE